MKSSKSSKMAIIAQSKSQFRRLKIQGVEVTLRKDLAMWKTEDEYLSMADEASVKKQPFSAVVYTLLALVSIFRDLRDIAYDVRNHYDNYQVGK